jgi:hypothetical protein
MGTLIRNISCDTLTLLLINAAYMDLTVKHPDVFKLHTKTSLYSIKLILCKEATILYQFLRFALTKFRQNKIFSGDELSTCRTKSFLLTILNSEGNLSLRGLSPNHSSIQNLVWDPSLTLNEPNSIKESSMFIKLFQKCKSVGFLIQLLRVLSLMYLFLKSSYHIPSWI